MIAAVLHDQNAVYPGDDELVYAGDKITPKMMGAVLPLSVSSLKNPTTAFHCIPVSLKLTLALHLQPKPS